MAVMNDDRYCVSYDRQSGILRVKLRGFWDSTVLQAYFSAVEGQLHSIVASGKALVDVGVLIDRREQMMLPKELGPLVQDFITEILGQCGKLAVVVTSPLAKMQAARLSFGTAETFADVGEAVRWLSAADTGSKPSPVAARPV